MSKRLAFYFKQASFYEKALFCIGVYFILDYLDFSVFMLVLLFVSVGVYLFYTSVSSFVLKTLSFMKKTFLYSRQSSHLTDDSHFSKLHYALVVGFNSNASYLIPYHTPFVLDQSAYQVSSGVMDQLFKTVHRSGHQLQLLTPCSTESTIIKPKHFSSDGQKELFKLDFISLN